MSSHPLINEKDAAKLLNLSGRALQRARLEGGGPRYVQLTTRRIAYRLEDIEGWIAARLVSSTSEATVARSDAA